MLLHKAPEGLKRCRCKKGRCPYGGPVGQTVTRFRGTPEERAAKHSERKKMLKEDPASLIPKYKLASTGEGKHIRPESTTEELKLIKQAREYLEGRSISSIPVSKVEPNLGSVSFLPPKVEGKSTLAQKNGDNVRSVMRDNATGNISDIMSAMQKNQMTRVYFRGGGFETEGTGVGDKIFNRGQVWEDVELENQFKTRVFNDGRVSVEVPTSEGTSWMPVGTINAGEFATGQYLTKIDKAMTKLKSRKNPFKKKEDIQKALKTSFASAKKDRKSSTSGKPSYTPQTEMSRNLTAVSDKHNANPTAYFDTVSDDDNYSQYVEVDENDNRYMSTINNVLVKAYGKSKIQLSNGETPSHPTGVAYDETGNAKMFVSCGDNNSYPVEISLGKTDVRKFTSGELTHLVNSEVLRYERSNGTQLEDVDIQAIGKSVKAKLKD